MKDYSRMRPKNIKFDKERLYEDTLHLKNQINRLKEQNIIYKTQNRTLERENKNLQKLFEEMSSYKGNQHSTKKKQSDTYLVITLKK